MSLGSRMRECRIEQGMSLRQLGEKLNVSESTVQRYEKGIIKKLPEETINGIAAALGVSASYLLGEQETIRPEDKTKPVNLTNSEQVLVACYRRLGDSERSVIRSLLLTMEMAQNHLDQYESRLKLAEEFIADIGEEKDYRVLVAESNG